MARSTVIESITIADLGVIQAAEMNFGPGLTVITGETGAGKTMVLTGLGLLWGERADAQRVRQGASESRVEGIIRIDDPHVRAQLDGVVEQAGADWDGDDLILARSVTAEGRSRAYAGGRTVPAAVLGKISDLVVSVHGQHDQARLLQGGHQRDTLDSFGGVPISAALTSYRDAFELLRNAIKARQLLQEQTAANEAVQEDTRRLLAEIDQVQPTSGELERLAATGARLRHVEELAEQIGAAMNSLRSDLDVSSQSGADDLVSRAAQALERVAVHDPRLADVARDLTATRRELDEVALTLAGIAGELVDDPAALAALEERRATISGLTRRFCAFTSATAATEDEINVWAAQARERLDALDGSAADIEELDTRINELRLTASAAATVLSHTRSAAAVVLGQQVSVELAALSMPNARLEVQVSVRPPGDGLLLTIGTESASADRHGVNAVTFGFATRPDEPARELHRGVSGGERSRIMLALEVVLADTQRIPTMIFDEVDAGVGGRAAIEVGRRLARLSRQAQVIVVTHLPQVAVFGSTHLVVQPDGDGQVTTASVVQVAGDDRRRELARMLAGLSESSSAAAHAAELMDLAAAEWALD
jgi:DNA repair protein RecN (Recombination protein N)